MRILLYGLGLFLLVPLLVYAALVWEHNRTLSPVTDTALALALENSIQWLERNEESILRQPNPMLWWMVQQSAQRTQDPRLDNLFQRYRRVVLEPSPSSPWQPLFNRNAWIPMRAEDLQHMPYYNLHILYGVSCDPELGELALVQAQLREDFCPTRYPLSPACTTHQMMGMRFMQARGCGDAGAVDAVIQALQNRIVRQLTWDPRPVDVYLQRLLMLAESGQAARIKPVWLRRALEVQREDGGWSDFHPLFPLGRERYFGFSGRIFSIKAPRSSFHATAQGVYLLSLLQPAP